MNTVKVLAAHLAGAVVILEPKELHEYLTAPSWKIMSDFQKYQVCASLYKLADEFEQVFNVKKFAIAIPAMNEVKELIRQLKDGERAVIDSLDSSLQGLADLGIEIGVAGPGKLASLKRRLGDELAASRSVIQGYREAIKSLERKITDRM